MERSKDPRRLWRKDGRTGNELGSFATGTEERKYDDKVAIRQKPCMKCKKQHSLNDCQDFLKLTLEQRKEFVQSKGLCFGCLTWGHVNKNCQRKSVCKICGKFHPTLLHDVAYKVTSKVGKKDEDSSKDEEGQGKASSYRVNLCKDIDQITCPSHSLIVPVWLHHRKNPGRRLLVYALLDEQSDACFIKDGTLRKLGIEGRKVQLYLSTVLAEETVESEKIVGLIIQGVKEEEMIQLPTTYSRDAIPAKRSQIPRPETAMKWNHLQRIAKDLTPYYPEAEVCLLIGINCIHAIKPRDIIPGCDDEPYAQKTALGWGIIGIVDPKAKVENDNASDVLCNRVSCREVQTESDKVCHFVAPMQVKEVFSPSQVKKMFELDFSERDNREKYLSTEDMLFMDKVTKGIHQLSNGHYEIPLPFFCEDLSYDPEVRKVFATSIDTPETFSLHKRLEYFSDWHRARRATAVCLRLKEKEPHLNTETIKVPIVVRQGVHSYSPVNVEEINRAKRVIIKCVQRESFSKEIKSLSSPSSQETIQTSQKKRGRALDKTSSIHCLDPFLDKDGILRVGGRIRRAVEIPEDVRHPILLPKKGHITLLIVRFFHERVNHQGRNRTLYEIRSSGFWLINGGSVVVFYISTCVECRRFRGMMQQQKMADLPSDRMEPSPPFTYAAVDYFGPWLIKNGHKKVKRYGVLFTCMVSRAIHLETANALTTDSFLNAYRRFVARRGPTRQLRSHQGTNFVGARSELQKALTEMNANCVRDELLKD